MTTIGDKKNPQQNTDIETLKLKLDFRKFVATLIFGTVLGTILSTIISYKEVQIKENESKINLQIEEREELQKYFKYTMEGDVYDRLKLSMFFAKVLTDKDSRKLWEDYNKVQEDLLKEYYEVNREIAQIDEDLKKNNSTTDNLNERKQILKDRKTTLERLVQPVEINITSTLPLINNEASLGNWAIIFGGDPTHSSALDEIKRAKSKGYNQAQVYYRESSYRSVLPFYTRESANVALPIVRKFSFKKDAYLVNLNNWCPSPISTKDKDGNYFECK